MSRFAALAGIPERTYWRRLARHRAGDPAKDPWPAPKADAVEATAAKYAADWPAWGHRKIAAMMRADGCEVSTSTVERALRRRGLLLPSGGADALACLRRAFVEAERVLDLDDLRADRGEMDVVDADDYVIGQTAAPIAVVTDNGPCFRDGTFADAFTGDDPLLRHVRTRVRSPQTNGVVERFFDTLNYEPRDHRRRQCPRRRDQPVPPHLQHPPPPPGTRRPDAATGVPHQPGEPVTTGPVVR
ncbi:hypothetical protein [Streptomyces sp. NBC_00322]|uniref:hypothetical protein n=1 Tax=Streptomyces sp. NBC_00322 TaxID=2975712 RepID=UPI003FA765CB